MKALLTSVALLLAMLMAVALANGAAAVPRKLHAVPDPAYEICGAGRVFSDVKCEDYAEASDLRQIGRSSSTIQCKNYIQCGGGSQELYKVIVDVTSGTNLNRQASMYYARGAARNMDNGNEVRYCWKRERATGDGCACLCEAVLQGTQLGMRPECKCKFA